MDLAHRTLGMFEVRAILLGRMGKHQAALEIYVYRLNNFAKAEEYVPTPGYHTMLMSLSATVNQSIRQRLTLRDRSSLFYAFTCDPQYPQQRPLTRI